ATLARNPQARILLMSAEKFMLGFIAAVRANDMLSFKERLRAADLLAIDDLQFIIGKDSTQTELLHTFDEVVSSGGRLVVTADRVPHRLDGINQRLLSRLAGGLVADIDPPDVELRTAILARKAEALGADVPTVVLDWIANAFPRNVRELEGALNKLVAYATLTDTPIDLEGAQARLAEVARGSRARVTIEEIQRAVCAHYRIDKSEMSSQRRVRAIARPRQVAMYLAKELTPRSFPEIGRRFGGRDHSTVIHAVRTIESLRQGDADLDTDIRRIRRALTA
ncbi:MAG: chromosomal replication initiator protein DnaA, partial [Sphingopyxis sp.]